MNSKPSDDKNPYPSNISLTHSTTVTIGKDVYVIERHFSSERDAKEAIFTAVKNEAFRSPNS